jgi:hypothetical protein
MSSLVGLAKAVFSEVVYHQQERNPVVSISICFHTFEAVYISSTVQKFVVIDQSYKSRMSIAVNR